MPKVAKMQKGVMMSIHGNVIKVLSLVMLLLATGLSADSIKVRVGSTEVIEGSNMRVQLIAEGKDIEFPDIKDIGGFPVEGNSVSTKMESSYINGKFSSKNLKTLHFNFFPELDVTIPAFIVKIAGKEHKTKPIPIKVMKASAAPAKSVDGYTMSMKSSKDKIYVGEPFIVTVEFFEPRSSSVSKVEYTPPKFKGFFSQVLGDEKLKRNSSGTIHQLQYLLSAKKQGNFNIMPPKARVGIRSFSGADRDPWGFFANDVKWYSVRSKSLAVLVKELPENTDLVGSFIAQSSVDKNSIKPNAPVTYTIKITGEGSLEDIEDPKFELPNVTIYSDDAKTKSEVIGDKVMSSYEKKYVFISDSDFTIPSLSFSSFDYKSKTSKILKTKEQKIIVDKKNIATPSPSSVNIKKTVAKKVKDNNISILEDVDYYKSMYEKERIGFPLWSLLLAFVAGIITILAGMKLLTYFRQKKTKIRLQHYSHKEALKILYPHTNHSKKVEEMVRKLYEIENGNRSVVIDKDELAKMIEETGANL